MQSIVIDRIVNDFEEGRLSRRQLVAALVALGAAAATGKEALWAQQPDTDAAQPAVPAAGQQATQEPTFEATGLDHIALDVTDIEQSRDFYIKHLGLRVVRGDDRALFLGADREFFLTLFQAERPRMHHYCYSIRNFNADDAMQRLADAGLRPQRMGNRVYFPDPDDLTVQVTGR
jgi:catechol 2,3-dioxygenase-like lactoylglutathione lyase family enzyme